MYIDYKGERSTEEDPRKKTLKFKLSNTISTIFILACTLSSSYFALSLCRIGSFDFLFYFYALEGCLMFLAPF